MLTAKVSYRPARFRYLGTNAAEATTLPSDQAYACDTNLKDASMSVIVTALFPTKVEASNNFYDTLVSVLPETRAYEGCISVTPHRDLDDATKVVLIEEWESREHYLAYLQWRVETGLLESIGPMLTGEPVTHFYSNTQD